MGKSYDNKCVVMCLCVCVYDCVLTSVHACMHVMGGGGEGDGGMETPDQYISIRSNVEKLLSPM